MQHSTSQHLAQEEHNSKAIQIKIITFYNIIFHLCKSALFLKEAKNTTTVKSLLKDQPKLLQ